VYNALLIWEAVIDTKKTTMWPCSFVFHARCRENDEIETNYSVIKKCKNISRSLQRQSDWQWAFWGGNARVFIHNVAMFVYMYIMLLRNKLASTVATEI